MNVRLRFFVALLVTALKTEKIHIDGLTRPNQQQVINMIRESESSR